MADQILTQHNIADIFQNAAIDFHVFSFTGLYQADDQQLYAAFNERSKLGNNTQNTIFSTLDNLENALHHINSLEEPSKLLLARHLFSIGQKKTMEILAQGHALIRIHAEDPQHPAVIDSLKNQDEHQKHFQNALMQLPHP